MCELWMGFVDSVSFWFCLKLCFFDWGLVLGFLGFVVYVVFKLIILMLSKFSFGIFCFNFWKWLFGMIDCVGCFVKIGI